MVGEGADVPICMHTSPMAQVALLHTEMNSGFRLVPRMGMNSAGGTGVRGQRTAWGGLPTGRMHGVCARVHACGLVTNAGFDVQEAGLCQISQQSEGALPHLGHRVLRGAERL